MYAKRRGAPSHLSTFLRHIQGSGAPAVQLCPCLLTFSCSLKVLHPSLSRILHLSYRRQVQVSSPMEIIFLFVLLLLPALHLIKGTHWLPGNDANDTLYKALNLFSLKNFDNILDYLGRSPILAYIIDVHHPEFDCCAYLLCYTLINDACWHFVMGFLYVSLKHLPPLGSGLDWEILFPCFWLYFVYRLSTGIAEMFDTTLSGMLSSVPRLPFSPKLPEILVCIEAFASWSLGRLLAYSLGMDAGMAKLKYLGLQFAASYPETANWALCGGFLSLSFMATLFELQLVPLLINGSPLSRISYRITNILAHQIRARLTARRSKASFAFLGSGEDQYTVYQYYPLPRLFFRLLKLDASRARSGQVICSIEKHVEFFCPDYEAISYCWGTGDKTHSIAVDVGGGQMQQIKITKSAYNVIAALCPIQGERYLWIDSICINQDDRDERDSQIPLMDGIYGRASRVIAYLGTSQYASLANNFISRGIWHGIGVGIPPVEVDGAFNIGVPFKSDIHGWRAFRELTRNALWSRMWILQEVVLAEKLVIHNGGAIFPWPFLYNFEKMFKGHTMKNPHLEDGNKVSGQHLFPQADVFGRHKLMLDYRRRGERDEQKPLKRKPLADLLVDLRHLEVSPDHQEDRVNAVLAISTAPLRPDHTKTVAEVYTSAALHTLESGSFLIFSIAGLCHRTSQLDLPSWVPDLTRAPHSINDVGYTKYQAGTSTTQLHSIESDGEELRIFGRIIDEIDFCFPPATNPAGSGTNSADYPFKVTTEDMKAREDEFFNIESPLSAPGRLFKNLIEMIAALSASIPDLADAFRIAGLTAVEDFDGKTSPASDTMFRSYQDFQNLMFTLQDDAVLQPRTFLKRYQQSRKVKNAQEKLNWRQFFKRAEAVSIRRKFALTYQGHHAAMVPKGTRSGDRLCVFEGSPVPHVLRSAGDDGCFYLYGDAYVHGFMNGEALEREGEWITLV
jgi:hypothetical protein